MAKYKKAQLNIPMCLAAVLLCLTLISIHLSSGLYAKYVVNDSGSDSARVIKFGNLTLSETGSFNSKGELIILPGVDIDKKAVVDFDGSESATYVFVEVTATNWQSDDNYSFAVKSAGEKLLSWSVVKDWNFLKNDGEKYVYYRELEPNETLNDADIIVDGKIKVSDEITLKTISSLTGINIKLRSTVVQVGNFKNASEAWASVSSK